MPSKFFLLCCAIVANLALTIGVGCATRANDEVAGASAVPLAGTEWQLTQLGNLLPPPAGQPIGMQLQAQNTRVVGFSGCNRMFGAYALDGQSLKFAQMGGTKMACLDESLMRVEQDFMQMFANVSRWRITGSTLELLDANDSVLATFSAKPATG